MASIADLHYIRAMQQETRSPFVKFLEDKGRGDLARKAEQKSASDALLMALDEAVAGAEKIGADLQDITRALKG
jgi:hypothetical protein